jgi:hypothetical protein
MPPINVTASRALEGPLPMSRTPDPPPAAQHLACSLGASMLYHGERDERDEREGC